MTLPTAAYKHSNSSYFDATVDVPGNRKQSYKNNNNDNMKFFI